MQNQEFASPMKTTDVFAFPNMSGERRRILNLFGTFGGATATIGYLDPAGAFVSFKASVGGAAVTATASESWVFETPTSGRFTVSIAGATGTTAIKLTTSEAAL